MACQGFAMKQELLCNWLNLPKTAWPPDPWTLLGLTREALDLGIIEERVQDRMAKLRTYQLSYPEEATEGMNRLAEAFITLAEASCRLAAHTPRPPLAKAGKLTGTPLSTSGNGTSAPGGKGATAWGTAAAPQPTAS